MSEDNEMWRNYKLAQRARRDARLPLRQKQIRGLARLGYKIEQKTEYQFRVNDIVDLYPTHNRYHNLTNGRRGGYADAEIFIKEFCKKYE